MFHLIWGFLARDTHSTHITILCDNSTAVACKSTLVLVILLNVKLWKVDLRMFSDNAL